MVKVQCGVLGVFGREPLRQFRQLLLVPGVRKELGEYFWGVADMVRPFCDRR
jgi:hypothetical protein